MKILFAGDWHASPTAGIVAAQVAQTEGMDVIFHVGDFLYTGAAGQRFLDAVSVALAEAGTRLVFVRGNHDDTNLLRQAQQQAEAAGTLTPEGFVPIRSNIFYAPDALRWEWEGVRFGALGGAASVDREHRVEGESWWADECTSDEAVDQISAGGELDVLVMHDVPSSVFVMGAHGVAKRGLEDSMRNQQRLQRALEATTPSWAFSGHFHTFQVTPLDYGTKTGRHVVIDRGDYMGEEHHDAVLGRALFFTEIVDGELSEMRAF